MKDIVGREGRAAVGDSPGRSLLVLEDIVRVPYLSRLLVSLEPLHIGKVLARIGGLAKVIFKFGRCAKSWQEEALDGGAGVATGNIIAQRRYPHEIDHGAAAARKQRFEDFRGICPAASKEELFQDGILVRPPAEDSAFTTSQRFRQRVEKGFVGTVAGIGMEEL